MLAMQRRLSTPFLVLLTLPATAMGFALSVQISALSWILSTRYGLDIHDIGLVWAAGPTGRHHRPGADRHDQRPGLVVGRTAAAVHHHRWDAGGADDPRPALHRRHLPAPRPRRRTRRRDRGRARARPLDQRQFQSHALAHQRPDARGHRPHPRLHLDADGVGIVRRPRVRDRRGLRQLHADLFRGRPGAALLRAAGAAHHGAARAARRGGGRAGERTQGPRQLLAPAAPDQAAVGVPAVRRRRDGAEARGRAAAGHLAGNGLRRLRDRAVLADAHGAQSRSAVRAAGPGRFPQGAGGQFARAGSACRRCSST